MESSTATAAATVAAAKIATIGTVSGVFTGVIGQVLAGWFTSKRDQDNRIEARRLASKQRQNEFQRTTLFELQDAVEGVLRLAERAQLYSIKVHQNVHQWPVRNYTPKLSLDLATAFIKASKLTERVLDEAVRRRSTELLHDFERVVGAQNLFESRKDLAELVSDFERLNSLIGERLRILEDSLISL